MHAEGNTEGLAAVHGARSSAQLLLVPALSGRQKSIPNSLGGGYTSGPAARRMETHFKNFMVRSLSAILGSLALTAVPCSAQSYLYNRAFFLTGLQPWGIVAADFNGDGKLDLAVVNNTDNTVSILLGKPDSSFATHVDYPVGDSPTLIVAADFNGDGYPDLAVLNSMGNTISVLLGNGDGTFAGQSVYPVGGAPVGILTADFNGDRKADLAVASNDNSSVAILLGNGDGTFTAETPVAVGPAPAQFVSGDFNGDGKTDLLTIDNGDTVTVLLSKGDGTFSRVDTTFSIEGGDGAGPLAVGDFNRDGKLDVFMAGGGGLEFLEGQGDGTFVAAPLSFLPNLSITGSTLFAVDLNHDGMLDLVLGSTILIAVENGTSFRVAPYPGGFQSAQCVTDINGDGVPDLVFPTQGAQVWVLLGNGDGTFGETPNYTLPIVPTYTATTDAGPSIAGDFNGDGKTDFAAFEYNGGPGVITVALGKGDGTFDAPVTSPMTDEIEIAPKLADFNGDGKLDLAAWTTSPYLPTGPTFLSVNLGNGDGTFQPTIHVPTPSGAVAPVTSTLAAGDFNGDGKADLAILTGSTGAGVATQYIQILLGQGNGSFTTGATIELGSTTPGAPGASFRGGVGVLAADFNHDGKPDLAVTDGDNLAVLLGNGDGTFQTPSYASCDYCAMNIAAGDFNADGNVDVAASGYFGLSVFLGNGDGTLQPSVLSASNLDPGTSLFSGDVNGDGKLDLVFWAGVALGNGDGTFQSPQYSAFGPVGYALGDFNSDGIPDLELITATDNMTPFVNGLLSAPQVSFYPSTLSFPAAEVGVTSAAKVLTVTNIGSAPLKFSGIVPAGAFAQTNDCAATIPSGASCAINVTFTPTAAGNQTGSLIFSDNIVTSPQAIALSGTGLAPSASLSPGSLNFGAESIGNTSSSQSVTLSNTANLPLMVSSIAVNGDFSQSNNCGSGVAAASSCTIEVTFTPTASGARTGQLIVTDNAPGSPQSATLSGSGPDFTLASSSSATSAVSPGSSATYTLSIASVGGFNQPVTFTCAGAPSGASCSVSANPVTPAGPGTNVTVTVTTSAPSMIPAASRPFSPGAPPYWGVQSLSRLALLLLAVMGWVVVRRKRRDLGRWVSATISLAAGLLLGAALIGCGGAGGGNGAPPSNPGTPAGTYSLTVTGTAGSGSSALTHSVTLTLDVN